MSRPYIITIASEKGGVGKTTLATNLAIYLQSLAEDLPITLFSFDNHFTIDRMFQLGHNRPSGDVGALFCGTAAEKLLLTGQYGVNYIPSNRNLPAGGHPEEVDQLATNFSRSALTGIVIIDTSPVLDHFTRNALYAADRVIVPIKDAPSLENCRHLAEFMTRHRRSKAILKILPCLIDTRIRFDGPFRNSYQLLKAYAINRGYRCYEGFIAKSPKVETLGTNPTGKIFPVITHARNTDVHVQLTHLARQVYLDFLSGGPTRLTEVTEQLQHRARQLKRQFQERLAGIPAACLCCGETFPRADAAPSPAYYLESGDGLYRGFIEETCFMNLLFEDRYLTLISQEQRDLLRGWLGGQTEGDYLLLEKDQTTADTVSVVFSRLDGKGEKISGRSFQFNRAELQTRRDDMKLMQLFREAAAGENPRRQFLLLRRTGDNPHQVLHHQPYLEWSLVINRVQIDRNNAAATD